MGEIKEDLYIFLRNSDVSTVSEFETKFSARINLTQNCDFECALARIVLPTNIANCYDGQFSFYSYTTKRMEHSRIAKAFYGSPSDFIRQWNEIIQENSEFYRLSLSETNHFAMELKQKENSSVSPKLQLSQNIMELTGLPKEVNKNGFHISEKSWDISGGQGLIYIYTNLTEWVHLNGSQVPLLNVVSLNLENRPSNYDFEPKTRIYIPVQKRYIDNITVSLRNTHGIAYPFLNGEILIVLHIRPATIL